MAYVSDAGNEPLYSGAQINQLEVLATARTQIEEIREHGDEGLQMSIDGTSARSIILFLTRSEYE